MQDEMLAHRLGLVPLKVDPNLFEIKTGKVLICYVSHFSLCMHKHQCNHRLNQIILKCKHIACARHIPCCIVHEGMSSTRVKAVDYAHIPSIHLRSPMQ